MKTETTKRVAKLLDYHLDEEELVTFTSLDRISAEVADLVVVVAQRDRALACAYLAERVPGAVGVEARVAELVDRQAVRFLSFRDLERIRHHLGRDLEPAELETFDSFEQVTGTVEAMVARILEGCGRILAVIYLHERVPRCHRSDAMHRTQEIEVEYARRAKPASSSSAGKNR